MRRTAALVLAAALAAGSCAGPGSRLDPRTAVFPPPDFTPPRPERVTLANGLTVFLLEDHHLPLVEGRALIRTGAIHDPPGQTGLARLAGQLLTQGGTVELPGSRFHQVLEARAIQMGSEISSQSGSVTVNSLTAEWATALPLFTDVLRRPAFDPAQVDLGKKRLAEEIIRTPDSPDSLAFREFRRRLYAGNPRGRWATAEEVRHLTREDVEALHRSFFFPDRIILGFSGDFDRTHLLRTLEERLGDWQPAPRPLTRVPYPTDGEMDVALHLVDRDLPQTTLVLGHLAPPKDHPDHAALLVANFILGEGGFNSRMVREIRSDRGLAYSVGSYYRGDLGYGVLVASAKTRNDAVPEVLGRLTGIMEEMRSGGITPQELDWARDSILNGMIFRYDSPSAILSEAMSLAYDGLPGDFIDRLAAAIRALTPEEVSRAAARHLHPERLSTVILGRWSEFHHELPGDRARVRERVAPDGSVVPAE